MERKEPPKHNIFERLSQGLENHSLRDITAMSFALYFAFKLEQASEDLNFEKTIIYAPLALGTLGLVLWDAYETGKPKESEK